jgi:hypothetical protein
VTHWAIQELERNVERNDVSSSVVGLALALMLDERLSELRDAVTALTAAMRDAGVDKVGL